MPRFRLTRALRRGLRLLRDLNQIDFLPIRHIPARYNREKFLGDARAGLNVALLGFPQSMAYALIAGLPVQYGIYGSAVASLLAALFAGSRYITLGPTNATAVLLLSGFAVLGVEGEQKLLLLPLLLLLVGFFLTLGAWLRLANLVQYISRTVVTGYVTAAALLIIANQLKVALGFQFAEGEQAVNFFQVASLTLAHLPETHLPTVLFSLLTAGVYLAVTRWARQLPNVATTLVIMALAGLAFSSLPGGAVALLQGVPAGSWPLTPPRLDPILMRDLSGPALAIALLCVLEGMSIGKSLAARAGSRLDANQEMFAMGVANLGCAFLSGMPASGSLTRSVLTVESGARTTLTHLVAGLLLAVGALTLGPLISFIPRSALAVVVIFIGLSLINRHHLRIVTKTTMSDRITFFVTFFSGMILALDSAIYLGAAVSIALFVRKAARPEMVEYKFNEEGQLTAMQKSDVRQDPEVSIVHVEGELFFGAAELFRDQMRRISEDPNLKIIVLKMRNAHHLDASAIMALEELIRYMNSKGRYLIISEARKEVIRVIKNSGLLELLERRNLIPDVSGNPTLSTARALRRAKDQLAEWGQKGARVTIYVDDKKVGGDA